MNNDFRIGDYVLAKIINTYEPADFFYINGQYVFDNDKSIKEAVWFDGEYKHRINKVYESPLLVDVREMMEPLSVSRSYCRLLLRQGFDFENVFGLLAVIRSMSTGEVLVSRLLSNQDFHISDIKELVNGSFWMEEAILSYPRTDSNLEMQVTIVRYEDVTFDNPLGLIINYPNEFIPLIGEKPTPDFIKTTISFDKTFFLVIHPFTTENKTLKKSILDYFELEIASIEISHIVKYGNEEDGYYTLRVSNETNIYGDVKIGLDFSPFKKGNESKTIMVFVSTEINVDNKLMKRETSISTNILDIINPLITEMIGVPETIFPLNIEEKQVIKNTVIKQNVHERVVALNYPIFVQFITDEITYAKKTISFNNITEECYLTFAEGKTDKEQTITSKKTTDGVYYFDLADIVPLSEETSYKIETVRDKTLIGNGKVLIPKS